MKNYRYEMFGVYVPPTVTISHYRQVFTKKSVAVILWLDSTVKVAFCFGYIIRQKWIKKKSKVENVGMLFGGQTGFRMRIIKSVMQIFPA